MPTPSAISTLTFNLINCLANKGQGQPPYFGEQPRFKRRVPSARVTGADSPSDLDICQGVGVNVEGK